MYQNYLFYLYYLSSQAISSIVSSSSISWWMTAEIDARCRDLLMSDSDPLAATTFLKDYQHYSKMGRWTQYDEVRIELYISELGLTLRAGRMTIVSRRAWRESVTTLIAVVISSEIQMGKCIKVMKALSSASWLKVSTTQLDKIHRADSR